MKQREPVKIDVNPSAIDAKRVIEEALERGKTIVVVGSCEILYKGRASSTLGVGERIVIITNDKALLIHRSYGYRAVNWQPAGCIFRVQQSSNKLEITAVRMRPLESVKIILDKLYSVSILDLVDESKLCLYASELDMKKAILYRPSLVEDGFAPITSEKEMVTGFVDIFGKDKNGNYVIIEIKRGKATKDASLQLARYIEDLRKRDRNVRGILVAESITKEAQRSIVSLNIEFRRLSPRKCSEILREIEKIEERDITDYF
nr:endonuclease NucS [Candidatus Njordarchaeum guaymaensis]